MSEQDPLAHICPFCGELNNCSMAKKESFDKRSLEQAKIEQNNQTESFQTEMGSTSESICQMNEACWCMSEPVNPDRKKLPNSISSTKRCLCKKCLQQQQTQQ